MRHEKFSAVLLAALSAIIITIMPMALAGSSTVDIEFYEPDPSGNTASPTPTYTYTYRPTASPPYVYVTDGNGGTYVTTRPSSELEIVNEDNEVVSGEDYEFADDNNLNASNQPNESGAATDGAGISGGDAQNLGANTSPSNLPGMAKTGTGGALWLLVLLIVAACYVTLKQRKSK